MEKDTASIRLLFTRHGQTEQNHKAIICGQQPGTLTKVGREQAKKIGVWLNKQKEYFDHIYVSDLGRTKATFDNLKSEAKYLEKVKVTYTPLLRQKGGGVLEGRSLGVWKQEADKAKLGIRQYKCEKGESWQDVNARCFDFLKLVVEEHIIKRQNSDKVPGEVKIFAVSHGGYLMEFHNLLRMTQFKQAPVFKNTALNCSFHQFLIEYPLGEKEYKLDKVRIKCTRENLVDHLKK